MSCPPIRPTPQRAVARNSGSFLPRRCGTWALAAASALVLGYAGEAAGKRLDFGGEVRADNSASFGSVGQFGALGGGGPCGYNPTADAGAELSGSVAALLHSARYRHQLTASLGYYALYCTPLLRRPVGGIDYRGEHTLGERTRLQGAARYTFDVFDRSFDALSGTYSPAGLTSPAVSGGKSAGLPYMIGQLSFEVTHALSKRYGLRGGMQVSSLEILGALNQLPYYSTLGPMEAVAFSAGAARDENRHRFELTGRYRASTYYSAGWLNLRTRGQVPAAHDVQLTPGYEYKLSTTLTLRVEAGAAIATQPHLCVQLDPLLIAGNRCSIDARAPGIRGYDGAPPLEAPLGRLATLTPVGEASLTYNAPRRRFELHLVRGYEPDPYAGALSLSERLSGNLHWRPLWNLLLYGNAQLLHAAQTSPARVSPSSEVLLLQPLSPQNRTLWMAMGQVAAEYHVVGPLSVFLETSFQALKIRGERVLQIPNQGPGLSAEVSTFPTAYSYVSENIQGDQRQLSLIQDRSGGVYQDTYRVNLILGVRGQLDTLPSRRREPDLFTDARAVP